MGKKKLVAMEALAKAQSSKMSNVANVAELEDWLATMCESKLGSMESSANLEAVERARKAKKWLATVARKHLIKNGNREPWSAKPGEEVSSWVAQAVAEGKRVENLRLDREEGASCEAILDWMRSKEGPSVEADWSKISFEQALGHEQAWIERLAKAAAKQDLEQADYEGTSTWLELAAEGFEGWRWVGVVGAGALDREGQLMRHCVGSYADQVGQGGALIYSLRDPQNKPRLTIEADANGSLHQLKGFANSKCPPELMGCAGEFLEKWAEEKNRPDARLGRDWDDSGWFAGSALGIFKPGTKAAQKALELWSQSEIELAEAKALLGKSADRLESLGPQALGDGEERESNGALPSGLDMWMADARKKAGRASLGAVEAMKWWDDLTKLGAYASGPGFEEVFGRLASEVAEASRGAAEEIERARVQREQYDRESASSSMKDRIDRSSMFNFDVRGGTDLIAYRELGLLSGGAAIESERLLDRAAAAAISHRCSPAIDAALKADASYRFVKALETAAALGDAQLCGQLAPRSDAAANDSKALAEAAGVGAVEAMKVLLPVSDPMRGAKDYFENMRSGWLYRRGSEPALMSACASGVLDAIKLVYPLTDPSWRSPAFGAACEKGRREVLQWLFEADASCLDASRALRAAVKSKNVEAAKFVIEKVQERGADPAELVYGEEMLSLMDAAMGRSKDALSYLADAAETGSREMVKVLAPHARKDAFLWALEKAAIVGDRDLVDDLLICPLAKVALGEPVDASKTNPPRPLSVIAGSESTENNKAILEALGAHASQDALDHALGNAAGRGNADAVKWLLGKGALPREFGHESALERAAKSNSVECLRLVFDAMGKDKKLGKALGAVVVSAEGARKEMLEVLLPFASLAERDEALDVASYTNASEMASLLIAAGTSPEAMGTAFERFARKGRFEMCKELMAKGVGSLEGANQFRDAQINEEMAIMAKYGGRIKVDNALGLGGALLDDRAANAPRAPDAAGLRAVAEWHDALEDGPARGAPEQAGRLAMRVLERRAQAAEEGGARDDAKPRGGAPEV